MTVKLTITDEMKKIAKVCFSPQEEKLKIIFPLPWAPKNSPGDIKVNEAVNVIGGMCKQFGKRDHAVFPYDRVTYDSTDIEKIITKLSTTPIIKYDETERVGIGNFLKFGEEDVLALNLTSTKSSIIGKKIEKISQQEKKELYKIETDYFAEDKIPPGFELDSDMCALSRIENGTFQILNPSLPSHYEANSNHDKADLIDISCFLYLRFNTRLSEGEYNELYHCLGSDYLVGDRILGKSTELFDVAFIEKGEKEEDNAIYLFHVKDELGQHTREACSQIRESAYQIYTSLLSTEPSSSALYELFEKMMTTKDEADTYRKLNKKKLQNLLHTTGSLAQDYIKFLSLFKGKIYFVYAFFDTARTSRHFSEVIKDGGKKYNTMALKLQLIQTYDYFKNYAPRFLFLLHQIPRSWRT